MSFIDQFSLASILLIKALNWVNTDEKEYWRLFTLLYYEKSSGLTIYGHKIKFFFIDIYIMYVIKSSKSCCLFFFFFSCFMVKSLKEKFVCLFSVMVWKFWKRCIYISLRDPSEIFHHIWTPSDCKFCAPFWHRKL